MEVYKITPAVQFSQFWVGDNHWMFVVEEELEASL
jgi:hypothetical protein